MPTAVVHARCQPPWQSTPDVIDHIAGGPSLPSMAAPVRNGRLGTILIGVGLVATFAIRLVRHQVTRTATSSQHYAASPGPGPATATAPAPVQVSREPTEASELAELERAFAIEAPDPAWSPGAESDFRMLLDVVASSRGSRVVSITCHRSVCRGFVDHPSRNEQQRFVDALPAFVRFAPTGTIPPVTTVYFPRIGLVL